MRVKDSTRYICNMVCNWCNLVYDVSDTWQYDSAVRYRNTLNRDISSEWSMDLASKDTNLEIYFLINPFPDKSIYTVKGYWVSA